jgi:dolichol-phosphate mannosyltransferase
VVPVCDEAENIPVLVDEIDAALAGRVSFEAIFINDGSRDATEATLRALSTARPWLRQLKHSARCGQSAALRTGVRAARSDAIVTLDGDGQNDPAFIPRLLEAMKAGGAEIGLIAGQRTKRRDGGFKKFQSWVANTVRSAVLRDATRDTGCGLKAFPREAYLALPYFDAQHRFLPALMRREGYGIGYVEVVDRPRRFGQSHYGMWNRLWIGIVDLLGVFWLIQRRKRVPEVTEVDPDAR